jgi:predicted nucleic acid-binding protein
VSLYEVFKRVLPQRGEANALQVTGVMQQGKVVNLDAALALQAASLSSTLKLPMADSIMLASARAFDAIFWTQDADFKGLPDVRFVEKG